MLRGLTISNYSCHAPNSLEPRSDQIASDDVLDWRSELEACWLGELKRAVLALGSRLLRRAAAIAMLFVGSAMVYQEVAQALTLF